MNRFCVWCRQPWHVEAESGTDCGGADPGVCPRCRGRFGLEHGTQILTNLPDLSQPVLAVDDHLLILAANRPACGFFGCDETAIQGHPLCDLLCPLPGSPRKGIHPTATCRGCPVRSLVNRTFEAGSSGSTALSARFASGGLGPGVAPLLVTSLWAGAAVALRIDPLADTA